MHCRRCGLPATLKELDDGYCSDECRARAAGAIVPEEEQPGPKPGDDGPPTPPQERTRSVSVFPENP